MISLILCDKHEEILESVWKVGERSDCTLENVRAKCVVAFSNADLSFLEKHNLLEIRGDRLLLSQTGSKVAEKIVRRHRIAEVLLKSMLKLKTAEREQIACKVEHSLQPEVEEAICTLLGHPEYCPDGKAIPKGVCCHNRLNNVDRTVMSLDELMPGDKGKVTYIKPDDHGMLEHLVSFGLSPGTLVRVQQKAPVFCVRFENTELALDKKVVKNIFVWKTSN